MMVVPKVEDEPRAAHLLPIVPGRLNEDVEKDHSIHFQHRLFKKKGNRDITRYITKSDSSAASADPLILALFSDSDSSSSSSDCG